ncbi:MAG: CCA tRNA nucleotidyltransferase [Acidithiobacillus sp.]
MTTDKPTTTNPDPLIFAGHDSPDTYSAIPSAGQLPATQIHQMLQQQWGEALLQRLHVIGRTAAALGTPAYLVGGCVRDFLQNRPAPDIDLAIEGDVRAVAEACSTEPSGVQCTYHPHFGTAILQYPDGFQLDLARCRIEHYPAPAALPEVQPGDIQTDLIRRDFTINAMAISLDPEKFGDFLDPYGGRMDLQRRLLRVLHPLSFLDDPTRILRGLRFAVRFQLQLETGTRGLLEGALTQDIFARLSGARLWRELKYLLELSDLPAALEELDAWQLWPLLRPTRPELEALLAQIQRGQQEINWFHYHFPDENLCDTAVLLTILWRDSPWAAAEKRLHYWPLAGGRHILSDLHLLSEMPVALAKASHPSAVARLWESLSLPGILALLAEYPETGAITESGHYYLLKQRGLTSPLNGKDLQAMGLAPGPQLGKVLRRLHDARLDGEIEDKETARQWLIRQGILPSIQP